jgi:hypothetical protein
MLEIAELNGETGDNGARLAAAVPAIPVAAAPPKPAAAAPPRRGACKVAGGRAASSAS